MELRLIRFGLQSTVRVRVQELMGPSKKRSSHLPCHRRRRDPADGLACGRSAAPRHRPDAVLRVVRCVRVRGAVCHGHGVVVLAALVL